MSKSINKILEGFDRVNRDAAKRILADPKSSGLMREWADRVTAKHQHVVSSDLRRAGLDADHIESQAMQEKP